MSVRNDDSSTRPRSDWWEALGLRSLRGGTRGTAAQLLREYRPAGFVRAGSDAVLSLEELLERLGAREHAAEAARQRSVAQRRAAGEAEFAAALAAPGAEVTVESGRWAGFTRGAAAGWCWNLFDYEPRGFVHPGSQLRMEALAQLRAGGLPEVFGYPERARELADCGMTPVEYRRRRQALGDRVFDPTEVRHG